MTVSIRVHARRAGMAGAAMLVALLCADPAASARAVGAQPVRCAGDAVLRSSSSRTVAYSSLPGATLAVRSKAADGRVLRLGATALRFRDFTRAQGTLDGGVLGGSAAGLAGVGASHTTIELVPHSSTHRRDVPTAFPSTNQLSVLRVTGSARVLTGFTVRATAQGQLYNGLRVDRVRDLRAGHIKVVGIPGNAFAPPGETFGINDYRTVGAHWSHVVVDGEGVGASGFGVNSSTDITLCAVTARNNAAAMGFAFWQTKGIRLVDCVAVHNGFSGFNFERTSGTVTLVRPVAHGNRYDMRIASDRSSARFRIVDPVLVNGAWTVWLPRHWYGSTNKQRASDITLTVHGRSRPDLLRIRTY